MRDLLFSRFGLIAPTCGEHFSDFRRQSVLLGQAGVELLLKRTAQVVFRYDFLYDRGGIHAFDREAFDGALPLFPDLF